MSAPEPDRFVVAVCQIGAERALKDEIARTHPELRPAFARPGLVTFKSLGGPVGPGFALSSVFARAWATAIGPAANADEVLAAATGIARGRKLRLHLWRRDRWKPGQEPEANPGLADDPLTSPLGCALLASSRFLPGAEARAGDHVLDVIIGTDEPLFVAHHLHSAAHLPWPGGRIPVEVPPEAPSRAYRKLEEAIAWSRLPLASGDVAVEIGSAPGGASYALLRRGLTVVGVDPGEMDPVVLASPRFRHLHLPIGQVAFALLPARVDWLLLDVNLAPQVALHAVRGLVSNLLPSLRGVLFTLKLNDARLAAKVPDLLRRIGEMGFVEVRATQLASNRHEVFACGENPKRRKAGARRKR